MADDGVLCAVFGTGPVGAALAKELGSHAVSRQADAGAANVAG